jgi:hypothetical protein
MSGLNSTQARQSILQLEQLTPAPYLFLGWSELGKQRVLARSKPLDAPMHDQLIEVYREFRLKAPEGRFTIWVGFNLHAESFRPQEFTALDSQLIEKAYSLPLGGTPQATPKQSG